MKKFLISLICVTVLTAGCAATTDTANEPKTASATTPAAAKAAKPKATKLAKPAKTKDAAPQETVGQANARSKGADYLDLAGFSRSGLIEQLEFDGFTTPEATYGADAQGADWSGQAVRKATDYLDLSGSRTPDLSISSRSTASAPSRPSPAPRASVSEPALVLSARSPVERELDVFGLSW